MVFGWALQKRRSPLPYGISYGLLWFGKNYTFLAVSVTYYVGISGWRRTVCRYDYDGEEHDGGQRESLSEGGFCRPYGGVACSPYIGNKIVYLSQTFRPSQVEESLRGRIIAVLVCDWVEIISRREMTRSNLLSPVVSYFVVNCFSCGAIDAGAVMTLVLMFRGLYVGHNRKPRKTDEQIETPFGVWNRLIGPKKPCIF